MKDLEITNCQYCGGEQFIEGRLSAYGGVYIETGVFRGAALYATVCRDCGSVIRTYCKSPESLYPKKERRKQNDG